MPHLFRTRFRHGGAPHGGAFYRRTLRLPSRAGDVLVLWPFELALLERGLSQRTPRFPQHPRYALRHVPYVSLILSSVPAFFLSFCLTYLTHDPMSLLFLVASQGIGPSPSRPSLH